jgi:methyltransferase
VPLVNGGPYRHVKHPNYAAVVGELVGMALMTGAFVTGPAMTIVFSWLMTRRIRVEQRALDAAR